MHPFLQSTFALSARRLGLLAVLASVTALSGCIGLGVAVPLPFGSVNIGAGPGGVSVGVGIGGRHGGVSIGGTLPVYSGQYHERHEHRRYRDGRDDRDEGSVLPPLPPIPPLPPLPF